MSDLNLPVICEFRLAPMNADCARAIMDWRYDAPYDVYNIAAAPDDPVVNDYLLPENAYFSIHAALDSGPYSGGPHSGSMDLIGYCCFGQDARVSGGDYEGDALDVGLGMHPALTGRGYGRKFVQAILDFGRNQYAPPAFRMTVAAFNTRAMRVYAELGFQPVLQFQRQTDGASFVVMIRQELRL